MNTLFAVTSKLFAAVMAMTIFLSFKQCQVLGTQVFSDTKDVMIDTKRIGRIRYHYFNDSSDSYVNTASGPCSAILMIGVGTAMSVEAYDNLAKNIVTKSGTSSLVVVISDPNPGMNPIEFNSAKYAKLSNGIREQLNSSIIPVCTGQQQDDLRFLIGGHSASGQAVLGAVQKGLFDFVPDGFIGLDPFAIDERTMDFSSPLQLPTLSWGFNHTTCAVQVEEAARGAYKLSSPNVGRVLYLIDNEDNGMTHCVFTDNGCTAICPTDAKFDWVYESVAESINFFVNVLQTDGASISEETFELPSTVSGHVSLFVNSDAVNVEGLSDVDDGGGSKSISSSIDTQ